MLIALRSTLCPDEKITKALSYIRANLRREVGIAELAKHCGLSMSHFASRFRRETGLSPHAMLTELRIERARELLVSTGLGLKEISAALGYRDASAFGRVFLRVCGKTPNAYRLAGRRGRFLRGIAGEVR